MARSPVDSEGEARARVATRNIEKKEKKIGGMVERF